MTWLTWVIVLKGCWKMKPPHLSLFLFWHTFSRCDSIPWHFQHAVTLPSKKTRSHESHVMFFSSPHGISAILGVMVVVSKIFVMFTQLLGKNHPIWRSHIFSDGLVVQPPTSWSLLRLGAADDTRELVRLRQVWRQFSVRKMLVTGDVPLLESFQNGDEVEWKNIHSGGQFFWSNYSDLTRPGPPNGGLVRENLLFQGKAVRWNIIIWPEFWKNSLWVGHSRKQFLWIRLRSTLTAIEVLKLVSSTSRCAINRWSHRCQEAKCVMVFYRGSTLFTVGGGFKDFLFSPLFREMIQFDEHIFADGLVKNHQLVSCWTVEPDLCMIEVADSSHIVFMLYWLLLSEVDDSNDMLIKNPALDLDPHVMY